ncbi:MAG: hypothetical protein IJZ47_07995 [Oscillospiraceae bacterium]|nr:hypothetical protein [Oscillospiraceae bacterium]
MEWFIENWTLILTALIVVAVLVITIVAFFKLPVAMQRGKIKEWLLWAVTECERDLGGGTGVLKLRQAWSWFADSFPWVSKIISFEMFSAWVDEALVCMKHILETNKAVAEYVGGESDE